MSAGYPYHLVHVQPKASASAIAASAAAAEFAYENMYEIEKEQVRVSHGSIPGSFKRTQIFVLLRRIDIEH